METPGTAPGCTTIIQATSFTSLGKVFRPLPRLSARHIYVPHARATTLMRHPVTRVSLSLEQESLSHSGSKNFLFLGCPHAHSLQAARAKGAMSLSLASIRHMGLLTGPSCTGACNHKFHRSIETISSPNQIFLSNLCITLEQFSTFYRTEAV